MAMGEVKRENNEASFTLNTSGNFSICGLSIPSPDRCINSSETDSTTPSSSTTHENCFFWMYCIVGFLVGVVIGGLIGGLIGIVIGVILQQILQLLVLKITSVAHSLAPPTLSTLNEISIQPSNKQTSSFQRAESETISFQASDSGLYRSISESCYNTAPSKSHKNEDDHAALSDPYSTESVSAASSDERQPNIVTGRGNRNMSNKSNENFASTPSD